MFGEPGNKVGGCSAVQCIVNPQRGSVAEGGESQTCASSRGDREG